MARKTKFENIDSIMSSAAMSETEKKFSHAKINEKTIVKKISIKNIIDNPYQPRLQINNKELIELANSIKENGLLQPVSLNKIGKNKYEIIAGHRRVAAHKLLKISEISSIIVTELDRSDSEYKSKMAVNALIENIQRENLDVLETALSMQNLLNESIFKNKRDLAKVIGKGDAYITKILSILKLDDRIIKDLQDNKSIKDLESLYELQKIEDKEIQYNLYKQLIKGNYTRQELREYNKKKKEAKTQTKATHKLPYTIKVTNNRIIIDTPIKPLEGLNKKMLEEELNSVLKKYFNK